MDVKMTLGEVASKLVQSGMTVGLGSGTTAARFIASLGKRVAEGLKIQAIPSSEESHGLAATFGIPLTDFSSTSTVDIVIDGADEVDHQKRLIKGGGGALLREKIIASSAKEMIVIVEDKKIVDNLGAFGLPVEITPFGWQATINQLQQLGFDASLRTMNKRPYISDNCNYIVDIKYETVCDDPERDHNMIINIPGVVDTGFFIGIATKIIIGRPDGSIEITE